MIVFPAAPIPNPAAGDIAQVRAVAAEMEARLEVARSLPANRYLGQHPGLTAHAFGFLLILAFPLLACAAMVALLFTLGPVLWILAAAAVLTLVVGLLLGLPENRRFTRLRGEGKWAPAVWIAVDESAFGDEWEDLPVGHLIFTLDPDLGADLPRLVALGERIRSERRAATSGVVQEIQQRIDFGEVETPPLLLPAEWSGNTKTWFTSMEFAPPFLPDALPGQALFFVLSMPVPTAAWQVALLQSTCLWGDSGEALAYAYPLDAAEVAA